MRAGPKDAPAEGSGAPGGCRYCRGCRPVRRKLLSARPGRPRSPPHVTCTEPQRPRDRSPASTGERATACVRRGARTCPFPRSGPARTTPQPPKTSWKPLGQNVIRWGASQNIRDPPGGPASLPATDSPGTCAVRIGTVVSILPHPNRLPWAIAAVPCRLGGTAGT
jgi:hypothetical protein